MKIVVVLFCLVAVAIAQPNFFYSPYLGPVAYHTALLPHAPLGPDGRVVDTPEVSFAKAEHAAAHLNENLNQQYLQSISPPLGYNDGYYRYY